jgi:hypothetical protein
MTTADPSLPPTADRVASVLTTRWLGRPFEWHAVCPSTSDLAVDRARAGAPAGLVIAADAQTGGRGRLGRVWHSRPGENLYVSLLLRPRRTAAEIPPLTLLAGAAVARAVAPLGVSPRLKWPNDAQLVDAAGRRRKLAGVLTEMVSAGARVEHEVIGRACSRACWKRSNRCTTSSSSAGRPRPSRHSPNTRGFPTVAASTTGWKVSRWASIPTGPCVCATMRARSIA